MKVIQVNGKWDANGSFNGRTLQHISLQDTEQSSSPSLTTGGGQGGGSSYNDWNTVTNILKFIISALYVYQSKDGFLYRSADGCLYGTKH